MIGKKINQLATELAPLPTDLTIIGDPTTGVSKKITLEQISSLFGGSVSFYSNLAGFPAVGNIDIIYCAKDTNKLYLWSGSAYVEVFPSQALLDTYQLRSEKGNANGYASLDSQGKVPISQLPSSIMEYKGTWSAATNTPTLANGTGDTGDVYICNAAGSVNFGAGPITFAVGDYVIYSGSIWQRSSGAVGTVTSVAASITGNAINITGSPVTTSGTLAFAFAGTSAQYVNGAGNLITFPSIITQAQNLVTEVYNKTGATLTKGTVVYINGGQGNLPAVTKAIATGDSTSAQTYGIVQADITNMNNGYVVVAGRITDLDTQAYTEGTQLYLSSTTAGTYTSTKQYAPAHLVYVGIVVRAHPTQGVIEVKIQNGYEMDELHNVSAQSPSNGDILQYVTSTSLWTKVAGTTSNIAEGSNLYYTEARVNANTNVAANTAARHNAVTIGTANGLSLSTQVLSLALASGSTTGALSSTDWTTFNNKQNALTNPVTGTGTTNYLPKFTNASTIGNSIVSESGSTISVAGNLTANGLIQATSTGQAFKLLSADTTGSYITFSPSTGSDYGYIGSAYHVLSAPWNVATDLAIRATANLVFATGGSSAKMILNTSGNLGLGVTPSAWDSGFTIAQIGNGGSIYSANSSRNIYLTTNAYYASGFKYVASDYAGISGWEDGSYVWLNAPSGTAGNAISFTQAMTLTSGRNLLIGTTTDAGFRLDVNGTARVQSDMIVNAFTLGRGNGNVGSNTAFGLLSLSANTSGIGNTAIGNNTLQNNTTGTSNIAVGSDALNANTIGDSNVAIGRGVLQLNISGNNNNAVGRNSLNANISGVENSAFGTSALSTSTGSNNSAFGFAALASTTSGANEAFGSNALRLQTTGNFNAGFGNSAFRANTTGSRNTGIGFEAGRYIANKSTEATIVNNSIFVGWRTSPSADNQTNQIVIGYDATGLGSNTTSIGNSSTVTTAIYGDILIGTTTALASTKLTVSGSETASSAIARGGLINTTLVASANNDVLVGLDINPTFTNGAFTGVTNVGLRVQGTPASTTSPFVQILNNASTVAANQDIVQILTPNVANGVSFQPIRIGTAANGLNSFSIGYTHVSSGSTSNRVNMSFFGQNNLQVFFASGNIAMGGQTTDAGYKLDVNGTGRFSGALSGTSATFSSSVTAGGGVYGTEFYNTNGYPYNTLFGSGADATTTTIRAGSTSGYATSIVLGGQNGSPSQTIQFNTSSTERMRITSGGRVYIGHTSDYGAALSVQQPTSGNVLNLSNGSDADLAFTISQIGAGTKFAKIMPSVSIPVILGNNGIERLRIAINGNTELTGALLTGEPDTGFGRAAFKIGSRQSGAAFGIGGYIPISIDGTVYYINLNTSTP
jgi:hypothetical protein